MRCIIDKIKNSQTDLKLISENEEYLLVKAKFGPSKITKIPLALNEELAFLVGAIIGDGHLKKSKFQITLECTDEYLLKFIQKICRDLFERKFNINKVKKRKGKKSSKTIIIDSKAIHNLLNKVFEIPIGRKSSIVKIPEIIKHSNASIISSFIIGILLTEGGKRRGGVGISTASKELWEGLIEIFQSIDIKILKDEWIYKKYNKKYYGITFKPQNLEIIMRECRSGQTGQILRRHFTQKNVFLRGQA